MPDHFTTVNLRLGILQYLAGIHTSFSSYSSKSIGTTLKHSISKSTAINIKSITAPFRGDCFKVIDEVYHSIGIDFLGMHPDCTYLTNAGIRWLTSKTPRKGYEWSDKYQVYINPDRWFNMVKACDHFTECYKWLQKIGKGYIENPRMHPYAMEIIGIPSTQYIHPYYFGSPQMKETHLWLVGLDPLEATNMLVPPKDKKERLKWQNVWMASPGPKRKELRSKTDPKVAEAFATQWG